MTSKEALIHAAFKGLAEGLMAAADTEVTAAPGRSVPSPSRKTTRGAKRVRRNRPAQQLPLSPEMEARLRDTFVPLDPRSPMDDYDTGTTTTQDLDAMFAGAEPEAVAQFKRQMQMQREAAQRNPAPKQEQDAPVVWGGIPDR